MQSKKEYNIGKYTGIVAESYRVPSFLKECGRMDEIISDAESEVISSGRNLNVIADVDGHRIVIKSFGRQSLVKDFADSLVGSKARRTWDAASRLFRENVGTPFPVGCLEYWEGGRIVESYYMSEYQEHVNSFGEELINIYRKEPECYKLMTLMKTVAEAIAAMHRAGVQHNDLGNQNILLHREDKAVWNRIQFIDLNRSTLREELNERHRARDISRLNLPSELLRVFKDMYFCGAIPPEKFHRWERYYRKRYAFHCATRDLRHPVRWLKSGTTDNRQPTLRGLGKPEEELEQGERVRRTEQTGGCESTGTGEKYPGPKDIWIWDERSGQPINTLGSRDRNRFYPKGQFRRIISATAAGLMSVRREYLSLKGECWKAKVNMKGRVGIAIEPDGETQDLELALLGKLGMIPVLIRFYHHKGTDQWELAAGVVNRLSGQGRKVTVALVQDRRSASDPDAWKNFVKYVLDKTAGQADCYELGHAVNRVKWGIWDIGEYNEMAGAAVEIAGNYPDVKFIGPAVIDFEYPFLLGILKGLSSGVKFASLSHHLYVDRRGAPENRQGPFAALEKFILARAIGRHSGRCGDGLVVSEVNWPVKGSGVYSPVGSPYESPQPRATDPNVSEDDYADFMLRYIMIALCSGMVDQVFWWRLVARGYGLVDDTDPDMWRERAGYAMLEYFLRMLGTATFNQRGRNIEGENPGLQLYEFETASGSIVNVIYTTGEKKDFEIPFDYERVTDAFGIKIEPEDDIIEVTGRPVYVFE